ncbi:MAG: hypothetical protein AB7F59_07695 [Bdellovibrionales bacterium]
MLGQLLFFLCLIFLTNLSKAFAFPEMVRHGYVNCTTCHVSPSGGGAMTPYGRSLSKEILSTWSYEGEENVLHGAVTTPEWLMLGGDIRYVQTYLETPVIKQGDFFMMNADAEVAVQVGQWVASVTAGVEGGPATVSQRGQFISRRHYLNYRPTDEISVRAGKFLAQYGVNQPNHTIVTERGLQFDQGSETYNLELAYMGENYDSFLTVITGRPDDPRFDPEKGMSWTVSKNFLERMKVGLSYYRGESNQARRMLVGPYAVLGITKDLFLLSEMDYQVKDFKSSVTAQTKGLVSYHRLNYEFHQGMIGYLVHQLSYLNFDVGRSRNDSMGVGIQFFPRPHFEFQVEYYKQRTLQAFDRYYDVGYAILHYYL